MKKWLAMILALALLMGYALPAMAAYDTIKFGSYEQDNNPNNGKEPIEWLVLERSGDYAMLISKYCLDAQPYHGVSEDVTWENSTLRVWLTLVFAPSAFSASEQQRIMMASVPAEENPNSSAYAGNDTEDAVFLLSRNEAKYYFPTDKERRAKATPYAKANGAYANDSGQYTWWLRTPGKSNKGALSVYGAGDIRTLAITNQKATVSPVIWIEIN